MRYYTGFSIPQGSLFVKQSDCYATGCTAGFDLSGRGRVSSCWAGNCNSYNFIGRYYGAEIRSSIGFGAIDSSILAMSPTTCWDCTFASSNYGIRIQSECDFFGCTLRNNLGASVAGPSAGVVNSRQVYFTNCLFDDSVEVAGIARIYSHKHDQIAGNHKIFTAASSIYPDTAVRHTASGVSWKFEPVNYGFYTT